MSLRVPDELLSITGLTGPGLAIELALEMYQRRKLSMGKAAELAGMSRMDFQSLLASRGGYLNYGVDDLENDLETLRRLRRR
jgi:predicted HTH domain antitoxin